MSNLNPLLSHSESEIEKFIDENLSPFHVRWLTMRARRSGTPGPGFLKRSYQIGSADAHPETAKAGQTAKLRAKPSRNFFCAIRVAFSTSN
jgi:hypothetical protein